MKILRIPFRYHLEGPKKGSHEVFADNLPGMPDDLGASEDGKTYWVALHGLRHAGQWLNIPDLSATRPWLRTIYVYVGTFREFEYLNTLSSIWKLCTYTVTQIAI